MLVQLARPLVISSKIDTMAQIITKIANIIMLLELDYQQLFLTCFFISHVVLVLNWLLAP